MNNSDEEFTTLTVHQIDDVFFFVDLIINLRFLLTVSAAAGTMWTRQCFFQQQSNAQTPPDPSVLEVYVDVYFIRGRIPYTGSIHVQREQLPQFNYLFFAHKICLEKNAQSLIGNYTPLATPKKRRQEELLSSLASVESEHILKNGLDNGKHRLHSQEKEKWKNRVAATRDYGKWSLFDLQVRYFVGVITWAASWAFKPFVSWDDLCVNLRSYWRCNIRLAGILAKVNFLMRKPSECRY